MRDAFGGSFLLQIFIVFLLVYIVFIALCVNYASSFKVKNAIINYLEQNNIYAAEGNKIVDNGNYNLSSKIKDEITSVIAKSNYNSDYNGYECTENDVYCENGVKITAYTIKSNSPSAVYYKVTTYIGWNLAGLNKLFGKEENETFGHWEISGYTKQIIKG